MSFRQPLLAALLIATVLSTLSAGCGSSDEGSGYGSRDSSADSQTATATTPDAPPGASARTCEGASADGEELRVTGIGCDVGLRVARAWAGTPSCSTSSGGSRFACTVGGGYRCLGARTERGIAVSCARPGASASFIAKAG